MGINCYFYFRFVYVEVNGYILGRGWGTVEGKGGGAYTSFIFDSFTLR